MSSPQKTNRITKIISPVQRYYSDNNDRRVKPDTQSVVVLMHKPKIGEGVEVDLDNNTYYFKVTDTTVDDAHVKEATITRIAHEDSDLKYADDTIILDSYTWKLKNVNDDHTIRFYDKPKSNITPSDLTDYNFVKPGTLITLKGSKMIVKPVPSTSKDTVTVPSKDTVVNIKPTFGDTVNFTDIDGNIINKYVITEAYGDVDTFTMSDRNMDEMIAIKGDTGYTIFGVDFPHILDIENVDIVKSFKSLEMLKDNFKFITVPKGEVSSWKGDMQTVIFDILYLLEKYPGDKCVVTSTKEKAFRNYSLIWTCDTGERVLIPPTKFMKKLDSCMNNNKVRFIFIQLLLVGINDCVIEQVKELERDPDDNPEPRHANVIIIDKKFKTVERFEPHGPSFADHEGNFQSNELDRAVEQLLIDGKYLTTYYTPSDFCPYLGPQTIEEFGFDKSDKIGFCLVWTFWYLDMRFANPDIPPKELLTLAYDKMQADNGDRFKEYILAYSQHITEYINRIKREYIGEHTKENVNNYIIGRVRHILKTQLIST